MPPWTGYFDQSGSPALRIGVRGVLPQPPHEFHAVIDTGFTGFVSLPLVRAFPLGLVLTGSTEVRLADGSTSVRLTAAGTAGVGGEEQPGLIILEPSAEEVLVGMDFLREFRKTLVVSPLTHSVSMVD